MDVQFVNRYTLQKEGQAGFFIDPTRRQAERNALPRSTGGGKRGEIMRVIGLTLAVLIMLFAIVTKAWAIFFMGLILTGVYSLRIMQTRSARETQDKDQAAKLQELIQAQEATKWIRFLRFGENTIEVEDPNKWTQYYYNQIVRLSQDPAYITLWMDDDTQVRVYKKGFIIGTLEGFESFITKRTGIKEIEGPREVSDALKAVTSGQAAETEEEPSTE